MAPPIIRNTIHARIKADILEKIVEGNWKPGFQLPIETELADSYGVSRMTMNKVLTQLSNEGYLFRRKKKGTFVAEPRAQSAVMEITDIEQEVLALNKSYRWELLQQEKRCLSETETKLLELQALSMHPHTNDDALFVKGVHYSSDKPFCLETRMINPETVPQVLDQTFETILPGTWLLKALPWTRATHRIRAVSIANPEAKLLQLDTGHACLEILRNTEIDGKWVTWARLLYPGEAHQLVAQF